MSKLFTKDQTEWITLQLKIFPNWKVLEMINEEIIPMTAKQFKCWRSNHKIFSDIKEMPPVKSKLFSDEIQDFIKNKCMEWEAPYAAKVINERFNTNYTAQQIKNFRRNHNCYTKLTGAYNEHRPNPNKGNHKYCVPGGESTRFKKGERSYNTLPVLSVRKRPNAGNYFYIKVKEPNVWMLYSRYLWEQKNGPLKPGEKIKYLDGNPDNLSLDNMIVIDNKIQGKCINKYSNNPEITKANILLSKIQIEVEKRSK